MLAASFSSAILGSFMCALVIVSRRYRINSGRSFFKTFIYLIVVDIWGMLIDNIATPLASSLSDLLTLIILGLISSLFMTVESKHLSSMEMMFFILKDFIGGY
jgi:solute carrier family 41